MKVERLTYLIVLLVYLPIKTLAQGSGPPPPGLPDPPPATIEQGTAILFTAGIVFGLLVMIKKKS